VDEHYDPVRAAEPLRHALDLALEWTHADPSPEPKVLVAVLTREKADILWETGDLNGARDTLLESLAIFGEVLAQDPKNGDWDHERLVIEERLGLVSGSPDFFNLGDRAAASDWLHKLVNDGEQRVTADPNDVRARFDLSESLAELAAVYRDTEPQRAQKLYQRSLDLSNSALKSSPQDADILNWQSLERVRFAGVLERLGQRNQAIEELRTAVAVAKDLVARDATNISARQLLGVGLRTRASHLLQTGDASGAEHDLQQSQETLANLYRENPNNLMFLRDLADCYRGMGDLAARRSDWEGAKLQYQKSLQLWDHWTTIGKSTVYDQQQRQLADTRVRNVTKHLRISAALR